MHQPRPYGRFGDESEEDRAHAERLMRQLGALMEISGIPSARMTRTLPGGGAVTVSDMGGIRKAMFLPTAGWEPSVSDSDLGPATVPMLFCGTIDNGRAPRGGGLKVKLTEQTRKRLAGYDAEEAADIPKEVTLRRFVVDINVRHLVFKPKTEPEHWEVTQYDQVRPTWWSGAMAEVVQIVGGYGRQDFDALPDNKLERARMELPQAVLDAAVSEIGTASLPGYTGRPPADGQFRVNFHFNDTNSVGFDGDGRPWLTRIAPDGVHAMPLPLIPLTTTKAFREFIEESADDEILWAIDRFGGLPSGEGFPATTEDFQAWKRAGVITKVCDVADFYQHLFYGSAMGWAVNSKGTEGFNTCFDYDEDTHINYSYGYKLKLAFGSVKKGDEREAPDEADTRTLNEYLPHLYRALSGGEAKFAAIKYKLRRTPWADMIARAKMFKPGQEQAEVDHWDNLQAEPIATHSGSVSRVSSGAIGWRLAGFKFPEPLMEGCISFQSPAKTQPDAKMPRCDTILAGYYIGDSLKVIKYFSDPREYKQDNDERDPCSIVGSWTWVDTGTPTGLQGSYYTSDFDDRKSGAADVTVTDLRGSDLGYDTTPNFSFDEFFHRPGTLWRNRFFKHETTTKKTYGSNRQISVCMPYLDRNAVLHAREDTQSGASVSYGASVHFIRDPTSYRYWTDDFVWAWRGGVSGVVAKVPVYPKNGNPVWVVQENYDPGACSDFADQGPWIPSLPADYTWLIHPDNSKWQHSGGGGGPSSSIDLSTPPGKSEGATSKWRIDASAGPQLIRTANEGTGAYHVPSPDPYVGVFYRGATKIAAGVCNYAVVGEPHPTLPKTAAFQGWSRAADSKHIHHFIGVINE